MAVVSFPAAVLAGSGQKCHLSIRERFVIGQPVNPHPGDAVLFIGLILLERHIVLRHAGYRTGTTPGAFVQIDHHAVFVCFFIVYHQNLFENLSTSV
jgi:hypothetical protein